MQLSVIICTRNPAPDYLRRTLEALKNQTLARERWELLLVDNASDEPLANAWDLSWHPQARHLREDELGVAPARVRGIKESTGELVTFVDDDTVFAPDYLQLALAIHAEHPEAGAFGAGKIVGEFAAEIPKAAAKYLPMLALRDDPNVILDNVLNFNRSLPYGAGQCVIRQVALAYVTAADSDGIRRRHIGRRGLGLSSCEDMDMALFACQTGFFTGVFPELKITHLIPARRLKPEYLIALAEGHAAAQFLLARIWGYPLKKKKKNALSAWFSHLGRLIKYAGLDREIYLAQRRGERFAGSICLEARDELSQRLKT
jgi:glycosyltransferase involved in cell wall biosynthesis